MKVIDNTVLRRTVEHEYEDGIGGFTKLVSKMFISLFLLNLLIFLV
jgi:hypothetical protein